MFDLLSKKMQEKEKINLELLKDVLNEIWQTNERYIKHLIMFSTDLDI